MCLNWLEQFGKLSGTKCEATGEASEFGCHLVGEKRRVLSIHYLGQKVMSKFKMSTPYEGSHTSERSGFVCISHVMTP